MRPAGSLKARHGSDAGSELIHLFMYFGFLSVVVTLIMLGVLVLIHEFGHFAVAKAFGVRVEQFAIGFGKRLFGVRRGDTDYRVNLLPFGGYVKMSGENPLEGSTGDPAEFMSHPRWQRFFIAIAGPAMNVLLAIAILTGVFMARHPKAAFMEGPAIIGDVLPNSPAAKADIRPGDRIVRISGSQNPTWEQAQNQILLSAGQQVDLEVQRGSEVIPKKIVPVAVGKDEAGSVGWDPRWDGVSAAQIEHGMPADKAGMKEGDVITAVNGAPVQTGSEMIDLIQKSNGSALQITVKRDERELTFVVHPVEDAEKGRLRIGVDTQPLISYERLPFAKAFRESLDKNKEYSGLMFQLVAKLLERRASIKQLSSPIGIGVAAGHAAQEGWLELLMLTAMISLNLGILNLFPIPIMDGGVILLLGIEAVMRHDISMQVKERIYQAAFVFLVLFAAIVIYNDVIKIVPGS